MNTLQAEQTRYLGAMYCPCFVSLPVTGSGGDANVCVLTVFLGNVALYDACSLACTVNGLGLSVYRVLEHVSPDLVNAAPPGCSAPIFEAIHGQHWCAVYVQFVQFVQIVHPSLRAHRHTGV